MTALTIYEKCRVTDVNDRLPPMSRRDAAAQLGEKVKTINNGDRKQMHVRKGLVGKVVLIS